MSSSTSPRNFGFRRTVGIVREGRFRSPTATELRLGTLVERDPNDPLRIREATDTAIGGGTDVRAALCGVLWYEHDAQTYNTPEYGGGRLALRQDLATAPVDRLVQVIHGGKGVKILLKNTGADETSPGLTFPVVRTAVTMVGGLTATPTVAVGDTLGWDDQNHYWAKTTQASEAALLIVHMDVDQLLVECDLLI